MNFRRKDPPELTKIIQVTLRFSKTSEHLEREYKLYQKSGLDEEYGSKYYKDVGFPQIIRQAQMTDRKKKILYVLEYKGKWDHRLEEKDKNNMDNNFTRDSALAIVNINTCVK